MKDGKRLELQGEKIEGMKYRPLPDFPSEYSDELIELSEEEDEKEVCSSSKKKNYVTGLLFNREVHFKNPVAIPEMVFGNAAEFRELIRHYALKTRKSLKFVKNDKWKVRVKCVQEDCTFSVFCSSVGKSNDLAIKTMVEEHPCGNSMKIDMVKVKFLARKYINKIRRQPKKFLKNFIGDIYDDLIIEISVTTTWRAIKATGYLLYGNENQQFVRLWSYAKELLDTMPRSTVITKLHE
ncbi:hypothetical protein LIER_43254 [Lithospermum erythrorhizon]|uniref:Transposase MuDR plant domain-containing protein n=1 Tax=Lithospermum erythrorhizon TaxID=34254 RepID=A0AAV3PRR2_LITER